MARMLDGMERLGEFVEQLAARALPQALARQRRAQIITNLPEMLAAFETIHDLAGAERLIVAGHDPLGADRFTPVEPGIIKLA